MNPEAKQYDQRLGAEAIGIVLADQFEPIVLAALPPAMRSLLELLAAGEVGRVERLPAAAVGWLPSQRIAA